MLLDRSSPVPLHYQLRSYLQQQIEGGALKPGDAIPTERELVSRFGVSRITVRQAVSDLTSEGFLYRQHGRGTYVRSQKIEQELSTLTGFAEEMAARGLTPGARLISAELVESDGKIASALQIQTGDQVFEILRVRLANGEPMALEVTYYPVQVGERLLKEELEGGLWALLEDKFGIDIDWADETIGCAVPSESTAHHLGIKKGTPVLVVERTTYSPDSRPMEFCWGYYRADRYSYRLRLKRKGRRASSVSLPSALTE